MSKRSLDSPDVCEESRVKRLWLENITETMDVTMDAIETDGGITGESHGKIIGVGYIGLRILQILMTIPAGYGLSCEQLTKFLGLCNERQTWIVLNNTLLRQHLVAVSDDNPPYWLITVEGSQVACTLSQSYHGGANNVTTMSML